MHKKLALLLLVLLVGCGGPRGHAPDFGDGDGPPHGPGREEAAPRAFDTAPFDLRKMQLPPAYEGHDVAAVYSAFEQRQAGGMGVYAFRENLAPGPPGNDFSYNRDRGAFKVRIRIEPFYDAAGNVDESLVSFVIAGYAGAGKPERKYDREAREKKWLLWEVSLDNGRSLQELARRDRLGAFLSIEGKVPREPETLPRDISALLVCRPRSAQEGLSTTVDVPSAVEGSAFRHYYLKSDLVEVWVYDHKTGRVFSKQRIAGPP